MLSKLLIHTREALRDRIASAGLSSGHDAGGGGSWASDSIVRRLRMREELLLALEEGRKRHISPGSQHAKQQQQETKKHKRGGSGVNDDGDLDDGGGASIAERARMDKQRQRGRQAPTQFAGFEAVRRSRDDRRSDELSNRARGHPDAVARPTATRVSVPPRPPPPPRRSCRGLLGAA